MPDKLTDKEIVKDFTEKTELIGSMSSVYLDEDKGLELYMAMRNILDLINRLQAENERLRNDLAISKKETKRYKGSYKTANAENEKLKNAYQQCAYEREVFLGEHEEIKTEAYKDCIEKVKKKYQIFENQAYAINPYALHGFLNNLLKELVGEDNA